MHAHSSLIFTALLVLASGLGLVAAFMFGKAVFETIAAVVRFVAMAFVAIVRFTGNSVLALGWYFLGTLLLVASAGTWLAYVYWIKPGQFSLLTYRPPVCTELLDRKGDVLDYLCPFDGVRVWRPIEAIGVNLRMIVVMLEDDKFYEHGGLDVDEIWNSIATDFERRKFARGGSTITQQLAKNLFLSKEKSFWRKASEVPLAMRLERELSKDQILELYLNTIEWGPGVFGVEAASRLYFDHPAATLTDEEAWLLALMIPNPKLFNPWINPRAVKTLHHRASTLSKRLYFEHRMSRPESEAALAKFEKFLSTWPTTKPLALHFGRKYPARWAESHDFSLAEIVSIRRGAAGVLQRFRTAPLRTYLDRALQAKLESRLEAIEPNLHAHDLSDVAVLMDGDQIRAIVPITKSAMLADAATLAKENGLKAQIFPARNIPPAALWP